MARRLPVICSSTGEFLHSAPASASREKTAHPWQGLRWGEQEMSKILAVIINVIILQ